MDAESEKRPFVPPAHSFPGWIFNVRNHALDIYNRQFNVLPQQFAESPTQTNYLDRTVLLERRSEQRITMLDAISEKGLGRFCKIINTPQSVRIFQLKDLRDSKYAMEQTLVMERMFSLLVPEESKLLLEHLAFLDDALVIMTPDGLEGTLNFGFLLHEVQHLHVLLLVGKGNKATISIEIRSESPSATYGQETFIGDGSAINLIMRESATHGNLFSVKRNSLASHASLTTISASKSDNGKTLITKSHTLVAGEHAFVRNHAVFVGHGTSTVEQQSDIQHTVGGADAETITKGIVADSASCLVKGTIHIEQSAGKTKSHYEGKVLETGAGAKANVLPTLRIFTNDVQAKHGAGVGHFNEEDVFYLMSRGLSQDEAKNLLVEGFFHPLFIQFPRQDQEGLTGFFRS